MLKTTDIKFNSIINTLIFAVIVINVYAKPFSEFLGISSVYVSAFPLVLLFIAFCGLRGPQFYFDRTLLIYTSILLIVFVTHFFTASRLMMDVKYLLYFVCFLMVISCANQGTWKSIEAATIILSIIMSLEVFSKLPFLIAQNINVYNVRKYVLLDKPVYSFVLGLGCICCYFIPLRNKQWGILKKIACFTMMIIFALVNFLVVQSKIFILGICVAGVFAVFFAKNNIKKTLFYTGMLLLILLVIAVLIDPSLIPGYIYTFINKYTGLFSSYVIQSQTVTYSVRSNITLYALSIFIEHPVFGIGYGNYELYAAQQVSLLNGAVETESTMLNMLVEGGLLGFLSFVGILAFIFFSLIKQIKYHKDSWILIELLFIVVYLTVLACGNDFYNIYFWTIMGFAYIACKKNIV